ncbi:hypothetical protein HELRODRAFT_114981 [Helobdella robusta]|uniref:Cytochrome b-c1 complex subunit 6 n=1 Tax=Helobdella robusta TaxID=6412 RepID=T1EG56_HELRO|nr:hypothetical protein HELRODRAFT_114981 [Helobdella robusta]ESN95026.1 hypothetical protein HELRODRAFT_114981 [Helobdella robusta]
MAEEKELVDPMNPLKEECSQSSHCLHLKDELDRCTERVTSRTKTTETCTQELFDFIHCVDHCVCIGLHECLCASACV